MTVLSKELQKLEQNQRTRIDTTLLDLVWAVSQTTDDDKAVAETVAHLINSRRARLTGTFKNARLIIV